MRVLTVVGNRPQFVKAAAVSDRLRAVATECLVHTGQHYDDALSAVFFEQLSLPRPDFHFQDGGGSNTSQTARMLVDLEELIHNIGPDAVLVYGDTNSTLAGALAAAQAGVPLAHVEAGMRSFDRSMPEELNRVLSDHASTLLLCSSETARANLEREGVHGDVVVVGDVMVDVFEMVAPRAPAPDTIGHLLVTAHRAGTVDDPDRLRRLVELLRGLPGEVVFPLHPRTRRRLQDAGLLDALGERVRITEPLGYVEFLSLLLHARAVLTDSGGVQKEAYLAGVPCVTLRPNTEWVETVESGWNVLVDLDPDAAREAIERPLPASRPPLYGDGRAGQRVVEALQAHLGSRG